MGFGGAKRWKGGIGLKFIIRRGQATKGEPDSIGRVDPFRHTSSFDVLPKQTTCEMKTLQVQVYIQ